MSGLKKVGVNEPREWIEAFWAGEKPAQIPYTIYYNEYRHTKDDPYWNELFEAGLRVTYSIPPFKGNAKNVECSDETIKQGSTEIARQIMRTPVGEITQTSHEGWTQKFWLKTAEDYRVMQYIIENTDVVPDYELYNKFENEVGPYGIVHSNVLRTPMQTILVDYVGLENFGIHLFEHEAEMMGLYEALLKQFARRTEIVAEGPGKYVSIPENFTADTMGPKRFEQFHIPVYEKYIPILHQAGKIAGTHYDGQLSVCSELIANSPIDMLESLTPPPEGDMELDEARKAWPNILFWSNINVTKYQLPPKELRQVVIDSVAQSSPDGKRLAFEVSEHIPVNWKESIPVVLEALSEIAE